MTLTRLWARLIAAFAAMKPRARPEPAVQPERSTTLMPNIFTEIKTLVATAWVDFQAGLKWFNTEAAIVGQALVRAEPAVAAAAQKVIASAETGAEFLIQYTDDALAATIQAGGGVAEEAVATFMSSWLGGNMGQQLMTAGGQSLFGDGIVALKALVDGAAVKLQAAALAEAQKLEADLAPKPAPAPEQVA